jgi:hypothetical protein
MILYAHYSNPSARTNGNATVRLSTDMSGRDVIATIECKGKREARAIAKQHNAQAWNY